MRAIAGAMGVVLVACAAYAAESKPEAKPAAATEVKPAAATDAKAALGGEAEKVGYALGYKTGKQMQQQEIKINADEFKKGLADGANATPEKLGYAFGVMNGYGMKEQGIDINIDKFAAGLADAIGDKDSALSETELKDVMKEFQATMMKKAQDKQEADGKKSDEAGKKFIDENKKKEGVKTTASGLQYKVVTEGKGAKPTAEDTVKVHYKGALTSGTEFDSSYKRGEPAEFPVKGVIKGWTEALQLMPVGSKWQLVIPSDLAYGEQGMPPTIPPKSVLVFDVELLEIVKAEAEAEPAAKKEEK